MEEARKGTLTRTGPVLSIAAVFILAGALAAFFFNTYAGHTLVKFARGGIPFGTAVTRVILEYRMTAFGVPEEERRQLEKVLEGVPGNLEGTSESDRRRLARLVLDSGRDGALDEEELAGISGFLKEMER